MGAINYPFGTYPRAIIRSDLTAHAKALYVTLSDYTTVNRLQCFPSKARLRSQLRWSDHTLEKYTRELITAGWITRQPKRDEGGRFSGWLYHVHTSPNITSDQAGGSTKPISSKADSTGRQDLRQEVKQQSFEEEPQKQEEHTDTEKHACQPSQSTDRVCCSHSFEKTAAETSVEAFKRFVPFSGNLKSGTEESRAFSAEEIETMELTIERYRSQGTLRNLPGLIRYFSVQGVDTTSLSGLRQWKAEQNSKAQTETGSRELENLRIFENHILSCKRCKPGELCQEGEGLRPQGAEELGCWGCEHFERDEGLAALNMGRCRFQNATVRHPMTHQCAAKPGSQRERAGE